MISGSHQATTRGSWRRLEFLRRAADGGNVPNRLQNLWIERPKVVLERGVAGTWDEFGVRDPALLVNLTGHLVRKDGKLVLYYTGSHKNGSWQGIGRAVSSDEGSSWERSPRIPVVQPSTGDWDSGITSTPWIILDQRGVHWLYYRGGKAVYEDEAIGLAVSDDGVHFERATQGPILRSSDFVDLRQDGYGSMGVVNVVRLLDGRYLLTFEGPSISCGLNTQIFGAVSIDRQTFSPLNNGYPIFTAGQVKSWPVVRVANPRITVLEKTDLYLLCFNGAGRSGRFYAIGLAFSRDLNTWWEHPNNPLLLPSGQPIDNPFSGRIEGGVFVKDDMEQGEDRMRVFVMGIPNRGPSHKGSAIGLAYGQTKGCRGLYSFRAASDLPRDVVVSSDGNGTDILCISQAKASSFPPTVDFFLCEKASIQKLSMDIHLDRQSWGTAFLVLRNEVASALVGSGIPLRFHRGKIYLPRRWYVGQAWIPFGSLKLMMVIDLLPWFWWVKAGRYRIGTWHNLILERRDKLWIVLVDGQQIGSVPSAHLRKWPLSNIMVKSSGTPIQLRNLQAFAT